jgi:hypothetical protein
MGMKGGDGASGETPSKIDSIRSQLEKVEILLQEQTRESQELKAQVAESKSLMKSEIKDQLDDFLTKFMRLQSSTPPLQAVQAESVASNMSQVLQKPLCRGEISPANMVFSGSPGMPIFNLSASPQSHPAPFNTHASTSC